MTVGGPILSRQPGNCRGAGLHTQFTMIPRGLAALHAGASLQLHPLVWIGTVRPVLSSEDALPMRAFAAFSLIKIGPVVEVLLGGELALPVKGGKRQPLDRLSR